MAISMEKSLESTNIKEQATSQAILASMAKKRLRMVKIKKQLPLHLMLLPSIVIGTIFMIVPLFGLIMAFQKYNPALGVFRSQFVDIFQFKILFNRASFPQIMFNTVWIALNKIFFVTVSSIILSLLLNEVTKLAFKRAVQTIVFLPYFLSWALIGSLFIDLFASNGPINYVLMELKLTDEPIFFLASNKYFRTIIVGTEVWKMMGYQAVVFLAAITNIDPSLYEAADVDGANKWQMCRFITLPGISSMITLISILNLGNIMNAGFEQIFIMYSPSVYDTADILDTVAYREGITNFNYSLGTAVGLFKSVISCILFVISYRLAFKLKNYRLF